MSSLSHSALPAKQVAREKRRRAFLIQVKWWISFFRMGKEFFSFHDQTDKQAGPMIPSSKDSFVGPSSVMVYQTLLHTGPTKLSSYPST